MGNEISDDVPLSGSSLAQSVSNGHIELYYIIQSLTSLSSPV